MSKMQFLIVLLGICSLLNGVLAQGFKNNLGINDLNQFQNQFRRQLSSQQHILTDVQQHHTQPRQVQQQQPLFVQQTQSVEVPITQQQQQQQQRNHFAANVNNRQNGFQHNNQFQRSTQNQLYSPHQQQQPNLDLHTQNFLTLKNYANQQIGPQQSLPQRSFSNKPFQPALQQQPQQYSTLPASVYQQQPQTNFGQALPQTQQKLPSELSGSSFQQNVSPQKVFSTVPQLSFQQQPNQQQLPVKQQQPSFQVTPNLGIPVPQIFPHLQSTGFPPQQQQFQQQQQGSQQQRFAPQQQFQSAPTPQPQTADQEYKQKLIQKHEQFVQKQYEKSQNKVRQQHEDFLAKQQAIKQQVLPTIIGSQQQYTETNYNSQQGRPVAPAEYPIFTSALEKYHQEHPTTTTTTTTTTEATNSSNKLSKDIYAQVKAELGKYSPKVSPNSKKPVKTIGRDELLKQLKAALAETPQKDIGNKTYDEMDLVLPNGQRVQVIRTTDPNLVQGQQAISQDQLQTLLTQQVQGSGTGGSGKLSLADVAPDKSKDLVLPNGSKVQILRSPNPEDAIDPQSLPGGADLSKLASLYGGDLAGISSGANSIASSAIIQSDSDEPPSLEELAKRGLIPDGYEIEGLSSPASKPQAKPAPTLPPKKKATYVYLEEQADGSFKIQGVKANGEKETKQTGAEVESILERIRSGEIKLPPSVQRLKLPNDEEVEIQGGNIIKTTSRPVTATPTRTTSSIYTTPFESSRTTAYRHQHPSRITTATPLIQRSGSSYDQSSPSSNGYRSTVAPAYTASPSSSATFGTSTHMPITERLATAEQQHYNDAVVQETENKEKAQEIDATTFTNPSEDLIQILKTNGLFAMAKYLRQSGLDSILNETGPYTIFVPTDKAFKNLLVQLGGPERAEEKFKANPRLLSGLLLHHVIPGAFEIATLQDEMTGVSLAGTQLRVNQYTMHDQEWNDVTLTTINGAMVVLNKKDIKIPQGIAHAVDRVMFPLPVGDLLQTLQSDRENRFTTFLKILYTSGLSEKLQNKGIKTYSVFAPVDKSFSDIESDILEKLYNDKEAAEEFAMKHIVSGTLFSAGMRFYQVKDSLLTGKTVILQKTSAGKIKVNDAQMVTSNIPATNGVIHAIDGVLA